MKRIILITGGQRSGKSRKAEELALSLSQSPVYLATAHIWDEEFKERVRKHQERRGPEWTNIEEEVCLNNALADQLYQPGSYPLHRGRENPECRFHPGESKSGV